MKLIVNGELRQVPAGATVGDLARELTAQRSGVAVAVNGEVVHRRTWDHHELHDGDRVEIVAAVQGGAS